MSDDFLTFDERRKLINIISGLPTFRNESDRDRFIYDEAKLGSLFRNFSFSGKIGPLAAAVVARLERYGQLEERQTYHSLGALLETMLELHDDELSRENAKFVAGLIVRYSLISNLDHLDKLRQQYGVTDEAIREPLPEITPPRSGIGKEAQEPSFDAQIGSVQELEQVINSEDNFLDIYLLYGALYCAQAVGRIEIERSPEGTGFLIGPDLLLTNQHVLQQKSDLQEAVVRFNYMNDDSGVPQSGQVVRIQSDFYYSSPAHELDYALVRLEQEPLKSITATKEELMDKSIAELILMGKHRGYLTLARSSLKKRSRVNIIQHPRGEALKVVLTQNYVEYATDSRVQYVADTMPGSSGSPVFNYKWEVVALHHSGQPYPPEPLTETARKAWKGQFRVNEGIPMKAILNDFQVKKIDCYLPQA
ncbi:MAG: serine protease [Nostoc sp. LLA-1]|nr:serine protease [Cyanocohniella sp. LLY]